MRTIAKGKKKSPTDSNFILLRNFAWLDFFLENGEKIVTTLRAWASPCDSVVKNPHAMQEAQEMRVSSLGWEDALEEEMATHSSILAWRIPWTLSPSYSLALTPELEKF